VPSESASTAAPSRVAVLNGKHRSGSVASLAGNDNVLYVVDSTVTGTRATDWYATFSTVPRNLSSLALTYSGSNTEPATQTISVFRWTDGTWVRVSSRSVGATEVRLAKLPAPGNPADYVSGTGVSGEVRVRIRSVRSTSFRARGEVMRIIYTH
jgi:hypothetical protein